MSVWIVFRQSVFLSKQLFFTGNQTQRNHQWDNFIPLYSKSTVVDTEVFAQIALKISVKRAKGWSLKSHSADVPSGKRNFETGGKERWKQKNSCCRNSINTNSMRPEIIFTFRFPRADSCSQKEFLWCLRLLTWVTTKDFICKWKLEEQCLQQHQQET